MPRAPSIAVLALLAMNTSMFMACVRESEGLTVDLYAGTSAGPLTFATDRGYTVELAQGWLATGAIELEACAQAQGAPGTWHWPRLSLIGEAQAHTMTSPTRLGTPFVEPLAPSPASEEHLGRLLPPPGRYCRLTYSWLPADADAANMPAGVPLLGKTLVLAGSYRREGGALTPFQAWTSAALDAALPLDRLEQLGREPDEVSHVDLVVHRGVEHWFDGLELDSASREQIGAAVLDHIRQQLSVEVR